MPSSLIVYFDYKSPYAFGAKASIYKLAKDFGLEVEWRPYSQHLPDFLGNVEVDDEGKIGGTRNASGRRTRYLYMDARRLAKDTDQDLMIKGPARVYNLGPRISVCSMLNARASSILITIWSSMILQRS